MRPTLYDPRFEHDACGVGFVARIDGEPTFETLCMGLDILRRLVHRGAFGSDPETGDGAGILLQVPDALFRSEFPSLPPQGDYAVGVAFLPRDKAVRRACREAVEDATRQEGLDFLRWREVPTNAARIGRQARQNEPSISQFFVGLGQHTTRDDFERKLYVVRRVAERAIEADLGKDSGVAFPSLSSRTVVYKGLLLPDQVSAYYADLENPLCASAIALVHQRFSTNTLPSWPLAHPYRFLAHNGEINTIQGNRAWLYARQMNLASARFGADLPKVFPVVSPSGSDSASLDQATELLLHSGMSLPEALMVLVPEAWESHAEMPEDLRNFYSYWNCSMEPWDGPASICFSDGQVVGGILDRNGLRPARYTVTTDGWVVYASESGVARVEPSRIRHLGRLRPGELFLVDTARKRIVPSDEVKAEITSRLPYADHVRALIEFDKVPRVPAPADEAVTCLKTLQRTFGYTREDVEVVVRTMATTGEESSGSMGNDTPIAILSKRPVPLFDYFRQLFAQVTNPAIDPIRESLVMSLGDSIGGEGSLLEPGPENARQIRIPSPVLSVSDFRKLMALEGLGHGVRVAVLDATFRSDEPEGALERCLERLCREASDAIAAGRNALVLSDRCAGEERIPVPSLLAVSAVQHHLVREGTRAKSSLVVESGEPREVHHFACLLGYGASAICPYVALQTCDELGEGARKKYIKAVNKGLLKVASKMGISTLRSYRGTQLFEAVGLGSEVVDRFFTGTPSRLGGLTLSGLERESRLRHSQTTRTGGPSLLDPGGVYQWRRNGERHALDPEAVVRLQKAVHQNSWSTYEEFASWVEGSEDTARELRGMMEIAPTRPSVRLDQVEAESEIVRRFCTGAMSLGSLSREVHENLARAMNAIGGRSNSGEGGEDPVRFKDDRRSAIKQVASGRFGVTTEYLVNADEIQIKVAQGAKPGEGGQLPGNKVDDYIGKVRNTTPGVTLISPPPHHDIYSIEDLAQLIHDLRSVNPSARVSVKLVSEAGVGTVAAGVVKADADSIVVSGCEGGTGAAPLTSIRHAGLPWELGIAETQQTLLRNGLRGRVRLQVDGQLRTGRDVVVAALLGADEFGFSTVPLVTQGCIMMRVCHLGTCPVGIATQDPELRKKFEGKPEHLRNYFFFVARQVRELMADLGFTRFCDMVGRVDCLKPRREPTLWKTNGLDLSRLLQPVTPEAGDSLHALDRRKPFNPSALEAGFLNEIVRALDDGVEAGLKARITNADRTFGALISGEVTRRGGAQPGAVNILLRGSAGQSFGAFLVDGVDLTLVGDANDYVGKGMSGGQIVLRFDTDTKIDHAASVIAGNTCLYGATGGRVFLGGCVGERFGVRNSGAVAVVEGVGDHACEYMTGGSVVVLGPFGRNLCAGMSGGKAFVFDPEDKVGIRLNADSGLLVEDVGDDEPWLREVLEEHARRTYSTSARKCLDAWPEALKSFRRIQSSEYKRVVEARFREEAHV